ncbi:DEAD/DEAH box helicase family protein [Bradyrhizobium sp. 14AA]
MSLRELAAKPHLSTSTARLLKDFYIPCLSRSTSYDRGVGFFTSNWLRLAATGLAGLAANGGVARIIASPILDAGDCAAINQGAEARNDPRLRQALDRALSDIARSLADDTLAALAWMVADGLLEFRVALPCADLDGDFHDKFGIFRDRSGDAVAFHGSPNDSEQAFRNYESLSAYYSWVDQREAGRVAHESDRFRLLWENRDPNLRVYELPVAVRERLIEFASRSPRPYVVPAPVDAEAERWRHQSDAVAAFLANRHGVIEMATGTGKTRTALKILDELKARHLIDTAVVAAYGTDLLDQWYKELVQRTGLPVYRDYENHRQAQSFVNSPSGAILLTSRQNLQGLLPKLKERVSAKALLVCDEVHGLGSAALVTALTGRLKPFSFRLGLSATPERVYDEDGNRFIENEIGPVIFRFGLREAIERGILCEFDYREIGYTLSEDDRAAVRAAIKRHHARVKAGQPAPVEALYRDIAFVRKVSTQKIAPFKDFIERNPEVLDRCIIFVETAEFGALVQPILMEMKTDFHTYYQDDDRANLKLFASGDLQCLLTCHRISEGIDIRSVNNIVLFASSRARLETVQRLGRCLRVDPANPHKRALVVDLVQEQPEDEADPTGELSADQERRDWFLDLASVRRLQDQTGGATHGG